MTNRQMLAVMVMAFSLAACEQERVPPAESPVAVPAPAPAADSAGAWTVSLLGVGPLRYGMDLAAIRAATSDSLPVPVGEECTYFRIAAAPPGMRFMLERGRLVRVDVDSGGSATARGARVGMGEAELRRLHGDSLTVRPHKYVPSAQYLIFAPADPADSHRVVFEVDSQRVQRFRAGVLPPVEYVEGCG